MSAENPLDSLDDQMRVIGACILDPTTIDEIAGRLRPEHFNDPRTIGAAWQVLCDMNDARKPIDPVLFAEELSKKGLYEKLGEGQGGCALWIVKCADLADYAPHAKHYASKIIEAYKRNAAKSLGNQLSRLSSDPTEELETTVGQVTDSLHELIESEKQQNNTARIDELLFDAIKSLDDPKPPGLMVGFHKLDQLVGGLKPGTMTVVAARPSVGKTAFVGNIALSVAEAERCGVLFLSLEQSQQELLLRFLACFSGVNHHSLDRHTLSEDERQRVMENADYLSELPVFIDDQADMSLREISAKTRRMTQRKGVKLLIVDYLQLITPEDRKQVREQQVATFSRRLKQLAKACKIPVIVLSQLNRSVEQRDNKRPKLSDLRESGAIEQDADNVWFLHRPEHAPEIVELIVAKNRNGECGMVPLSWYGSTMKFRDGPECYDPDPQKYAINKGAVEF